MDVRVYTSTHRYDPDDAAAFYKGIIQNNMFNDQLLSLPCWMDVGLLLYRPDLLRMYGFSRPPRTWDALEQMAAVIQKGERARLGTDDFWGYVHEGMVYEGLTCYGLELVASHQGGRIMEDNGKVTVNSKVCSPVGQTCA